MRRFRRWSVLPWSVRRSSPWPGGLVPTVTTIDEAPERAVFLFAIYTRGCLTIKLGRLLLFWAENETRTRDPNLGKVALSSPQNATRLGVTNWAISFYDDFLECVLPRFSHWLNGWLNICVCLLVCKWLLIRELFNGLNKFCNTFFLVIHWHSEFMVSK